MPKDVVNPGSGIQQFLLRRRPSISNYDRGKLPPGRADPDALLKRTDNQAIRRGSDTGNVFYLRRCDILHSNPAYPQKPPCKDA